MQAVIKDNEVKGVCVVFKDDKGEVTPWHMRVASPLITHVAEEVGDPDTYLWYVMEDVGWQLVRGPENYHALEAAYQEQL